MLESNLEQSTRDLAVVQSVDAQEQVFKVELKEQLQSLAMERNSLSAELGDLTSKLRYTESEVDRLQRVEQEQSAALRDSWQKQQLLMTQCEEMLQHEARESYDAMTAGECVCVFSVCLSVFLCLSRTPFLTLVPTSDAAATTTITSVRPTDRAQFTKR